MKAKRRELAILTMQQWKEGKISVLGLNFLLCIETAALAAHRTRRNFVSNVHLFERRHKLVAWRTFRSLKFIAQNTKL